MAKHKKPKAKIVPTELQTTILTRAYWCATLTSMYLKALSLENPFTEESKEKIDRAGGAIISFRDEFGHYLPSINDEFLDNFFEVMDFAITLTPKQQDEALRLLQERFRLLNVQIEDKLSSAQIDEKSAQVRAFGFTYTPVCPELEYETQD